MITITSEEGIVTKNVTQVQQIKNEMANITTREIPVQSQIATKGVDLKTEVSVDASTNAANDSV